MLGNYIDALPEVALRRVIDDTTWRTHGYVDSTGARCLLGHAENWSWDFDADAAHCNSPELLKLREAGGDSWLNWPPLIGQRFDHVAERLGLSVAVRLVRARAARNLAVYPSGASARRLIPSALSVSPSF